MLIIRMIFVLLIVGLITACPDSSNHNNAPIADNISILKKWEPAILIENAGGDNNQQIIEDIKVFSNGSGNALVVTEQSSKLWGYHYTADSGWSEATRIDSDSIDGWASELQVDCDGKGNAIAVWKQYDGDRYQIWTNYFTAGLGWGAASIIGSYHSPQIAMNNKGNAIAVYVSDAFAFNRNNFWARYYTNETGWLESTLIEDYVPGFSVSPHVAIDSRGNAIVVWSQGGNIHAKGYLVDYGWSEASIISNNSGDAYSPQVAIGPNGNALAVWHQHDGTNFNIWANHYDIDVGWGAAALIEQNSQGSAIAPQIGIDGKGNAQVVWEQNNGIRDSIWATRYSVDSGWQSAISIDIDSPGYSSHPKIVVNSKGDALTIWHHITDTENMILVNRYTSSTGWGAPTILAIKSTLYGFGYRDADIDIDSNGDAIAVWFDNNNTNNNIWSRRFE